METAVAAGWLNGRGADHASFEVVSTNDGPPSLHVVSGLDLAFPFDGGFDALPTSDVVPSGRVATPARASAPNQLRESPDDSHTYACDEASGWSTPDAAPALSHAQAAPCLELLLPSAPDARPSPAQARRLGRPAEPFGRGPLALVTRLLRFFARQAG